MELGLGLEILTLYKQGLIPEMLHTPGVCNIFRMDGVVDCSRELTVLVTVSGCLGPREAEFCQYAQYICMYNGIISAPTSQR
jgi:hypothetical protein